VAPSSPTPRLPGQGTNEHLNRLLMRLALRADQLGRETAERAFVEVRDVTVGLERVDHQIVYGRRGAGKTHAFRHLAGTLWREGDLPVYVDLRTVGSNGGIYGDSSLPLAARGTQLLIDVLEAVHRRLLAAAVEKEEFAPLLEHLDAIGEAVTQVRVEGDVTVKAASGADASRESESGWNGGIAVSSGSAKASLTRKNSRKTASKTTESASIEWTGRETPRVLFGKLSGAVMEAASSIRPRRIWLLLDEWSAIPLDLQPLLADMLRRGIFTCRGVSVKIGAIERRSCFTIPGTDRANYVGIELGADTAGALNLDEYMVWGPQRATFFSEVLYRHLAAMMLEDFNRELVIPDSTELAKTLFREHALDEFVRASEGVPRDALQIASLAAQQSGARQIGVPEIQSAARKFYLQDKETGIAGNPVATKVWTRLQAEVVSGRRSRTFLVKRSRERTHPGILDLYDARLIHLLQPGLATSADPGTLYDGYCLDYGSYVNLLHEAELDAAWNASGRPWDYRGGEPFLPDRFDHSSIFDPARAPTTRLATTRPHGPRPRKR
jgi:hypothetical protein